MDRADLSRAPGSASKLWLYPWASSQRKKLARDKHYEKLCNIDTGCLNYKPEYTHKLSIAHSNYG